MFNSRWTLIFAGAGSIASKAILSQVNRGRKCFVVVSMAPEEKVRQRPIPSAEEGNAIMTLSTCYWTVSNSKVLVGRSVLVTARREKTAAGALMKVAYHPQGVIEKTVVWKVCTVCTAGGTGPLIASAYRLVVGLNPEVGSGEDHWYAGGHQRPERCCAKLGLLGEEVQKKGHMQQTKKNRWVA